MNRTDNAEPNLARRCDRGAEMLKLRRREGDGAIIASAVIVREGVLEYPQPDGSIRRELVNLDAVRATADSIAFVPMTLGHPAAGLVTLDSSGDLKTGTTAGNAKVIIDEHEVEGGHATVTIVLTRKDAVEAFEAGVREVSCGYPLIDLLETPGRSDRHGPYDAIQVRGPTNHLAQVEKGRVENAYIRADSADAVGTWVPPKPAAKTRTDRGPTMNSLLIALCATLGVRYDSEDVALTEVTDKVTELKADNATLQKRVDEFAEEEEVNEDAPDLVAENKALKAENAALKAAAAKKDEEEEEMKADARHKALQALATAHDIKHDGLDLAALRLKLAATRSDSSADMSVDQLDAIISTLPAEKPGRADARSRYEHGAGGSGNRADGGDSDARVRADASDSDNDFYTPGLARADKAYEGATP